MALILKTFLSPVFFPPHYTSTDPVQDLRSYVAKHLKEEIAAEAVTLNISAFTG
jgi:hypothetical protein